MAAADPTTADQVRPARGDGPGRRRMLAGVALIVITGLIHAILVPAYLRDSVYIGVLFICNAIGGLVAAIGISRGRREAWLLGVLVAGGAFVTYIVALTAGLPGLDEHGDLGPLGIVSLIVEGGYCYLAADVLAPPADASRG